MLIEDKFIYVSLPRRGSTSFHYSCILHNLEVQTINDYNSINSKIDFTSINDSDIMNYIAHGHEPLNELQKKFGNHYAIIAVNRDRYEVFYSLLKHSIFDLKLPLKLQKKYLDSLNVFNVNYVELDNIKNLKKNSFLISNYAFSEISLDLQQKYTDMVLNNYVSHGFLTWNFINMYEFISNKKITVEDEYPLTDKNNQYVRFRPLTLNNC